MERRRSSIACSCALMVEGSPPLSQLPTSRARSGSRATVSVSSLRSHNQAAICCPLIRVMAVRYSCASALAVSFSCWYRTYPASRMPQPSNRNMRMGVQTVLPPSWNAPSRWDVRALRSSPKDCLFIANLCSPGLVHRVRAAAPKTLGSGKSIPFSYRKCYALLTGKPHQHYLRSEEHTSELQSPKDLVCRLLLEKKKKKRKIDMSRHITGTREGRIEGDRD